MRVLVYGMSSDKLGGIETFLINMNKFMSDDMIFDYIIEGSETIHQDAIDEKGGTALFIALKRKMLKNILDWMHLLKENKKSHKIVYFNMFSLAWSVPVFLAKLYGYCVIVHAHNNNLHDCGTVLRTMHKMNRFLLKYLKIVRFTNSDLSAKFFFGNRPAEMIYNAIDTEKFSYNPEIREKIRTELGVCEKHVYGFAGRIAYQKNPLFLMEIFSEIRKLDEKAAFVVCGDGDLMEATRGRAKELGIDVLFLGNVKDVHHYYQAMDCFVLPSRFEGLGIVLIEAQTAGLPCVTSKDVVPQIAQIVEEFVFIALESSVKLWGEKCVIAQKKSEKSRIMCFNKVKKSSFDIEVASRELEQYIRNLKEK